MIILEKYPSTPDVYVYSAAHQTIHILIHYNVTQLPSCYLSEQDHMLLNVCLLILV